MCYSVRLQNLGQLGGKKDIWIMDNEKWVWLLIGGYSEVRKIIGTGIL